jgi:aminoglycoside 3-N-acetyltransferase
MLLRCLITYKTQTRERIMVKSPSKLEALIASQSGPITRQMLVSDLRALGVEGGMTVLAHTSLSSVGWLPGGAATLALCLREALGASGTLVVPTQSSELSDPVHWSNPPIPREWFEETKATMAPFDSHTTPSAGQGIFPEIIRTHPESHRSSHPHTSFAALGSKAREIVEGHLLSSPLGENSPLQKLYDLDAKVLFIGTDYSSNTSFHLAEERIENAPTVAQGAPMMVDGTQQWVKFEAVDYDTEDFAECGDAFEQTATINVGAIGRATSRLFSIRSVVDFSEKWFSDNRS